MPSLGRMALAALAASSSGRLLRRLPPGVLLVGRGVLVGIGVGDAGLGIEVGVDAAAGAAGVRGVGDGGLEGGFGVVVDEGLVVGVEVGLEN